MTPAIALAPDPPTVCVHHKWERQPDGTWRCGNVMIQNDGDEPPRDSWNIYVRLDAGTWVRVRAKSRPWGYGHPGQAKIGAAKLARRRAA